MNMEVFLSPKESAKFIAENSKDVYIEDDGVQKVAEMLFDKVKEKEFGVAGWKSSHELNPQAANEDAVNWVFLADALNFSFWSEHEDRKCLVKYKGKEYSGYWSFCAAINRALDEGVPITSASYYATMTLEQVKHVFRSDTDVPMPLLEERHHVLNETGTVLLEKFGGSFLTCVKQSGKSAQKLLQIIVENFPSFRDEATFQGADFDNTDDVIHEMEEWFKVQSADFYNNGIQKVKKRWGKCVNLDDDYIEGRKVAFYKRAQILVADTWSVLEGKGDGCFSDISSVTIFADYRIPQVLVHLGAMKYSDELMKKLKEGYMFQSRDKQEVEIRGCSIWCCELICKHLLDLYKKKGEDMSDKINPVLLDYYLWDYARDHREDMKGIPFHRVRCIYY